MAWVLDLVLIAGYFVAIAVVGLVAGKREESLDDFALGGRRVPWWAVAASVIAAETSAATFLGAPVEGYAKQSLAYVQLTIGLVLGRWLAAQLFLRPFFAHRVTTVYDYLGIRFGPRTQKAVSALFLVMRTLASGTRLFIPSLVLVLAWQLFTREGGGTVTVAPVESLGPYAVAIGVLLLATAAYTVRGGIKAVIWTDVIQAALMFSSACVAIGFLLRDIGGMSVLLREAPKLGRLDGYFVTGFENLQTGGFGGVVRHILTADYTLFSALLGSTALNLAVFTADQDMVQRLLTAEDHRKARRSLMTAAVADIPIAAVFTFIGILLFAHYRLDPTHLPKATSDVFGSYILNELPPGVRGLVLAGVFATAMGSLSAALNALATSAVSDWVVPHLRKSGTFSDRRAVRAARTSTVVFSVLLFAVAVAFAQAKVADPTLRIIPIVLGIAAFLVGPMFGLFLLGVGTRARGNDTGNLIALGCGLATTATLGLLQAVAFTWLALIGALVVAAVGACFPGPSGTNPEPEPTS